MHQAAVRYRLCHRLLSRCEVHGRVATKAIISSIDSGIQIASRQTAWATSQSSHMCLQVKSAEWIGQSCCSGSIQSNIVPVRRRRCSSLHSRSPALGNAKPRRAARQSRLAVSCLCGPCKPRLIPVPGSQSLLLRAWPPVRAYTLEGGLGHQV
jgi:hypothetical protein